MKKLFLIKCLDNNREVNTTEQMQGYRNLESYFHQVEKTETRISQLEILQSSINIHLTHWFHN